MFYLNYIDTSLPNFTYQCLLVLRVALNKLQVVFCYNILSSLFFNYLSRKLQTRGKYPLLIKPLRSYCEYLSAF